MEQLQEIELNLENKNVGEKDSEYIAMAIAKGNRKGLERITIYQYFN